MKYSDLEKFKKLHFIGIGGSGMYPLVQILFEKGFIISGSDNNTGDNIDRELKMGLNISIGHKAENVIEKDAIVYSAAIMKDNIELVEAIKRNIPIIERSELLGILTEQYNSCYCVCGTHGKTTTSSMITEILLAADMDPTAVIGGKLDSINGSGRCGKTQNMVVEACEYVDTFLHLFPDNTLILNIDNDHLDYFKSMDRLKKSFNKFAHMTKNVVVYNGDDKNTVDSVKDITNAVSFGQNHTNKYYFDNVIRKDASHCTFSIYKNNTYLGDINLNIPGEHNIYNATGAVAIALENNIDFKYIQNGLNNFNGVHRRMDYIGKYKGITVFDDYAHHPTELKATLETCKKLGFNKVWAIFQPFTFSRTYMLMDEFADVLKIADKVILTPIMGGREINNYGVKSENLQTKIKNSVLLPTFYDIAKYVRENAEDKDLVITLGCGDIYKCAKMIVS